MQAQEQPTEIPENRSSVPEEHNLFTTQSCLIMERAAFPARKSWCKFWSSESRLTNYSWNQELNTWDKVAKSSFFFNSQRKFNISSGVRDVLLQVKIAQITGKMINTHYQSLAMFSYFSLNIQKNKIACSVLLASLFPSTH